MGIGFNFNKSGGTGGGALKIIGVDYDSIDQGTWAGTNLNTYTGPSFNNATSGAQNDKLTFYMNIPAGTYKAVLIATKSANAGIMKIDVNGVNIIAYDGYNAGTVYSDRTETPGLTIGASTRSKIEIYSNTKNAGSGQYIMDFESLLFIPS